MCGEDRRREKIRGEEYDGAETGKKTKMKQGDKESRKKIIEAEQEEDKKQSRRNMTERGRGILEEMEEKQR